MKAKSLLIAGIFTFSFLQTMNINAQEERPGFVTVTTAHWNPDSDATMKEWIDTEKEYFDKVIKKNDLIWSADVLVHYYTPDNSEVVFVTTYKNWEDIEKAEERNNELAKEAWPDDTKRKAYFQKEGSFYSNKHSDEIYSTLDYAKLNKENSDEPMVCYIRVNHLAFPPDGKADEINAARKEFVTEVIDKNPIIKGYYPMRHYWGSDSRDFVEAFIVGSLGDLEAMFDKNQELINAHWPDEAKRKAFFDTVGKYFTGWHGDFIYRTVPELSKN